MIKKTTVLLLSMLISFCSLQSQTIDTLLSINKHKLHFQIIKGEGVPILFEAGNGDEGTTWLPLLSDIQQATGATLITYDRAGLGKSSIDTSKILFKKEVKNLKKALKKLGYKKEFFLVAHSFGSFYSSEFAQRNKNKITGAVFIDVSTPCNLTVSYASQVQDAISKDNWQLIKQYKTGLYYVLKRFPEIAAYMSNRFIADSIPLTVIAADIRTPQKGIGDTEQDMINWTNCLKVLGNLPKHKYILATDSEHKVWDKSPQIVIQEIIELYKKTAHLKK